MEYPNNFDKAEQMLDEIEADEETKTAFQDEMIDLGSRIQKLGKRMKERAAPEDHAAVEEIINEACEIVSTLLATVDLFRSMTADARIVVEAARQEWANFQEAKRRWADG